MTTAPSMGQTNATMRTAAAGRIKQIERANSVFNRHTPYLTDPPHTRRRSALHFQDLTEEDYAFLDCNRQYNRAKMTEFSGKSCKNLAELTKSIENMPEKYKAKFRTFSDQTLQTICDPNMLHIWESDSDIDNLFQLISVLAKICELPQRSNGSYSNNDYRVARAKTSRVIFIAEERSDRDNFGRICELVSYVTSIPGKKRLRGTICTFDKIVVVRGWNNYSVPTLASNKEAAQKLVQRINLAVENSVGDHSLSIKEVVWHHGPRINFLLYWIQHTNSRCRSSLSSITITDSLHLQDGVHPSQNGAGNSYEELWLLERYAKRLGIPVVFLDSHSQLVTAQYLGTYMYFHGYYINTLLPPILTRVHNSKAYDELLLFAYRLHAVTEHKYGGEIVQMVQNHILPAYAISWARRCLNEECYQEDACRSSGTDICIHHASQLADSPFATLNACNNIPAFARLAVGPAAKDSTSAFIAAPVDINFQRQRMRINTRPPFFILLPASGWNEAKVTSRIQGTMMAVLESVRQVKGNPVLSDRDRDTWRAVVKACKWAIDSSYSGMPRALVDKVTHVKTKLREGTYAYMLGVPPSGESRSASEAAVAAANIGNSTITPTADTIHSFGYGAGQQQTLGEFAFAGPQHGYHGYRGTEGILQPGYGMQQPMYTHQQPIYTGAQQQPGYAQQQPMYGPQQPMYQGYGVNHAALFQQPFRQQQPMNVLQIPVSMQRQKCPSGQDWEHPIQRHYSRRSHR